MRMTRADRVAVLYAGVACPQSSQTDVGGRRSGAVRWWSVPFLLTCGSILARMFGLCGGFPSVLGCEPPI